MNVVDANDENSLSNGDLFRELKRLLPLAQHESYYADGAWKRKHLLFDIEIIKAHRKEAGAPEPLPVKDIPELVQMKLPPSSSRPPLGSTSRTHQSGAMRPPPDGRPNMGNASSRFTPKPPAAPPPRKIEEIKEFVNRWRMDPMRAMEILSRLRPDVRRSVMERFRPSGENVGPTLQLEQYIKDREQRGTISSPNGSIGKVSRSYAMRRPLSTVARGSIAISQDRGASVYGSRSMPLPRANGRGAPYASSRFAHTLPYRPVRTPFRAQSRSLLGARSPYQPFAGVGIKRSRPFVQNNAEKAKRARVEGPFASATAKPSSAPPKQTSATSARPGDLIKNLLSI